MCMGMDYEFWEPHWRNKYGTKPLPLAIQEAVVRITGKPLYKSSKSEIHKALETLGLGNLIISDENERHENG